jgi:hypothetical protein
MGIYDDIQSEISEALDNDLSDTSVPLTLVQVYSDDYDPSTGTSRKIEVETETRGVAIPVDISKIDGEALKIGDVQFLILDSELAEIPELGEVIQYKSEDYTITDIGRDPAESTWLLTGRVT